RQPSCRCISSFCPKHLIGRIGQAGPGSRLKLISSVGCPGRPPTRRDSFRGSWGFSVASQRSPTHWKQCRPAEVLRSARTVSEELTLRSEADELECSVRCKEFGLAGQLRLAG
ncbi:hypothetical protein PSHT_02097, partial [Puccinia striiformis]